MVYISPNDIELSRCAYVEAGDIVFSVCPHPHASIESGSVGMGHAQRKSCRVALHETAQLRIYVPPKTLPNLAMIYCAVSVMKKRTCELVEDDLIARVIQVFKDQIFSIGQESVFEDEDNTFSLKVSNLFIDIGGDSQSTTRGYLRQTTAFNFSDTNVTITGKNGFATTQLLKSTQLFKSTQLNFEQLGIGGLETQFDAIFRRAFASRVFPPSVVQKLGIKHVKGMLLYGPPGTGKTLIARQIGKMLNGREPKVVNGPEILNKFVGESEENIRKLFAEADREYLQKGDGSELHIIILDEIDAICKARGTVGGGTNVHDTVVNQLLTKIDGVHAINNILLIGMTNRKDMLDEALLRPGRLEVMIEVGLPDQKGRLQILKIHTSKMAENSFLDREVDLEKLSELTKNFSGAEIEGLVKSATSHALNRNIDINDLSKQLIEENIRIVMDDFYKALDEIRPAFGTATDSLEAYRTHGMINFGENFDHLMNTLKTLVEQVRQSEKTPLLTCVLEGPPGSGKSALAATVGLESGFPFVKVVTSDNMIGFGEHAKSNAIAKVFEDAYKSPLSMIILDDIERLLGYTAIGPRFSNDVLQTLLVLVNKKPPSSRKLLVIGTTSRRDVIESMGFSEVFNVTLHIEALTVDQIVRVVRSIDAFELRDVPEAVESIDASGMPIKKLFMWIDIAKQGLEPGQKIPIQKWQQVLRF